MDYVYILKCSDNTLYTGYTTDPERRIEEHNAGIGAKYTRGRGPVELVYLEEFSDKSRAMQREYEIKQFSKNEKLELIRKGTVN
ncbi:GIY-YIG nuclease family protein [Halanaerobiaceae bacterium Z-7014]|uniref:GIY-YIG nuclease family protein n=1 Tax=Halonatronomonas betaini TaxID=2778430 RepID=A0A931FAP5_9FIRM|nr:GIY-YIG nuclease family protein [Halonatronomonas betaini]MBF8437187.1 GIY-YIG nuclease family protein [Halonatronomonas betaini]